MKTNKAIDNAIIALRYWSENTEMGKQVCDDAISVLKTLKEDETINVTLELSRDTLKKIVTLSDCKGEVIESLTKVIFNENKESFTISKDSMSAEDSATIAEYIVNSISE